MNMSPTQAGLRWLLLLGFIFVFSLGLRVYRIGHQSFWDDETYTFKISAHNWPELNTALQSEDNGKPPLYYVMMHYWLRGGRSEVWARLPSAVMGALTCVVACLLGRFLWGARGWMLGFLLAISPMHIWYSQETRMYALLGLVGLLAFYFHARFCRDGRTLDVALFIFFGLLTCYSFPYGFFFLSVTAAYAALHQPRLSARRTGLDLIAHVSIFAIFALWIGRLFHAAATSIQDYKGHHLEVLSYVFINLFLGPSIGPPTDALRVYGAHALAGYPVETSLMLIGSAAAFALCVAGLGALKKRNWNAFVLALGGILFLVGGPFIVALLKTSVTNNPRYSFLALFPALIPIAFLAAGEARRSTAFRVAFAIYLGATALSLFNYYQVPAYARDDMRSAAHFLMKETGTGSASDVIFVCDKANADALQFYYQGSAKIVPYSSYAWLSDSEDRASFLKLAGNARHPALLYMRPDHGDPRRRLPGLFEKQYRLVDTQNWTGITCYRFDAKPAL